MRRLPSSWNRTMAKLGLTMRTSKSKGNRYALNKPLRGIEPLEDRRLLTAVGFFERLKGLPGEDNDLATTTDASAYAIFADGTPPGQEQVDNPAASTLLSNTLSRTSSVANAVVDHVSANAVGQSLSQILTDIGNTTVVPTVTQVAAQITTASVTLPQLPDHIGEGSAHITTLTDLRGDFQYNDETEGDEDYYGAIHLVGVGSGSHSGRISAWTNSTILHIQVWQNYTTLLADVWAWGGGSGSRGQENDEAPDQTQWTLWADVVGHEGPFERTSSGLNFFIDFTTPISDFDVITYTTQIETDSVKDWTAPGIDSDQFARALTMSTMEGSANANANFAEAINAFGYAVPEGTAPVLGIITGGDDGDGGAGGGGGGGAGPGGGGNGAPGDLNGDGVIDHLDDAIWVQMLADWAAGTAPLLQVTTEADENDLDYSYGDLSLREALVLANAHSGDDTIVFAPWIEQIELGAQLTIASDVNIAGPGADKLTIDANGASRVFSLNSSIDATISGMTITGGDTSGNGGGLYVSGDLELLNVDVVNNDADFYGGGAYVDANGTLTIAGSTFDGNEAGAGGGAVSGVFKAGTALNITGSTFSNNVGHAAGGGAILYYSNVGATTNLTIESSTFSGNTADAAGAIQFQNAVGTTITASIVNSTIAYNTATSLSGGGIVNLNGSTITLHNTILANNAAGNATYHDVWGSVAGGGASSYNLIGQVGGSGLVHNTSGNKVGTTGTRIDALLAPLGDYGGRTQTHALKTSSPALDAGKGSLSNLEDQRGFAREVDLPTTNGGDGYRDIGAYEAGEGTTLIVRSDGDRNNSVDLKATTDSLRLREALALSAALAGTEVISFDQSGWADETISLSSTFGALSIPSVDIEGPGSEQLTISGGDHSQVLSIVSSTANIRGLTIRDGYNTSLEQVGAIRIYNSDVTLDDVVITDSYAVDGTGGIWISGGSLTLTNSAIDDTVGDYFGAIRAENTDLTVRDSTISNNHGGVYSGGIWFEGSGDLKVLNSTVSGNQGYETGGVYTSGTGLNEIINSTIYNNLTFYETWYGGTLLPGGLRVAGSADVLMHNTILAGNRLNDNAPRDVLVDAGGGASIISTSSYNFIGLDSGNYFSSSSPYNNIRGTSTAIDPRLAPLADNGGPTKTHVPYYDSDVLEAGDRDIADLWNLDFDQRGSDRDENNNWGAGDNVDIGAVELAFDEYYS